VDAAHLRKDLLDCLVPADDADNDIVCVHNLLLQNRILEIEEDALGLLGDIKTLFNDALHPDAVDDSLNTVQKNAKRLENRLLEIKEGVIVLE
jgi:hypothetical protein